MSAGAAWHDRDRFCTALSTQRSPGLQHGLGDAPSALLHPGLAGSPTAQQTPPLSLIPLEITRGGRRGSPQPPARGSASLVADAASFSLCMPGTQTTWEGGGRGEGALGSQLAPPRSLPQRSQGGESQISRIPGHAMPCEVGRPRARPLLNPKGARAVWVGRTGRGCRLNGSVGTGCLREERGCCTEAVEKEERVRGRRQGEQRDQGVGAPHPDLPLAEQGCHTPRGCRRSTRDAGNLCALVDTHALSHAAACWGARSDVSAGLSPGSLAWVCLFGLGRVLTHLPGFRMEVTLCLESLEPWGKDHVGMKLWRAGFQNGLGWVRLGPGLSLAPSPFPKTRGAPGYSAKTQSRPKSTLRLSLRRMRRRIKTLGG